MTGRLPVRSGEIRFRGAEISSSQAWQVSRLGVGRKFQIPTVLRSCPSTRIFRSRCGQIGYALEMLTAAPLHWNSLQRVRTLEKFGFLESNMAARAGDLSQGMRQMLEFAMVAITEPRLLLLDEPCAGLSAHETRHMMDAITSTVSELDASAIVIEHDMSALEKIADNVVVLHQEEASRSDLWRKSRCRKTSRPSTREEESERAPGQAMLRFSSIVAGYGDTMVLKGISGAVTAGSVLGVFGRNGVGKSTLMRALTGVIQPTSGAVIVNGSDVGKVPSHQRRRLGMSYAPQERVVFDNLSVADNLSLGFKTRSLDAYDDLFRIFPRLKERLFQPAGKLSGGEKVAFLRQNHRRAFASYADRRAVGRCTAGESGADGVGHPVSNRGRGGVRGRRTESDVSHVDRRPFPRSGSWRGRAVGRLDRYVSRPARSGVGSLVSRIGRFVASCVRCRRPCRSIVTTARS